MSYNSIYSPKYYLKFLNWLNKNAVYNITSDCNKDRKVYLAIAMDYAQSTFIGDCIEECLDQAIMILENNSHKPLIEIKAELELNYVTDASET